jgi:hypothetical protein
VQDAEQWVRDTLGIARVDYRDATAVSAGVVNQALSFAGAAGMTLPREIHIDGRLFHPDSVEVARLLPAHGGSLQVNPHSEYWQGTLAEVARRARLLEATKVWSTGDARHPIIHELGHLAHWDARRASWDDDWGDRETTAQVQRALARQVSARAVASPAEFVAEVFAALALGKHYSPEVLAMFTLYGGLHS